MDRINNHEISALNETEEKLIKMYYQIKKTAKNKHKNDQFGTKWIYLFPIYFRLVKILIICN